MRGLAATIAAVLLISGCAWNWDALEPPATDATSLDATDAARDEQSAAETSTGCLAPMIECFGRCVDTSSDDNACGQCGHHCRRTTCVDSVCR